MKNVYDIARELTESLKETDQYKAFAASKKVIDTNPQLSQMITDFQKKSMEIQSKQMIGETPAPEDMSAYQQLYSIIISDPAAADYMQKQMVLSQILSDLYGIIGEALKFE